MTAKDRFNAAFEGKPGYPVALCYEGLFMRDHIDEVSDKPWDYCIDPDIKKRLSWHEGVKNRLTHDWIGYPFSYCYNEVPQNITKPIQSGTYSRKSEKIKIDSTEQIDARIPLYSDTSEQSLPKGALEAKLEVLYADRPKLSATASPFWGCNSLWDFETLMMLAIDNPLLLEYACERITMNAIFRVKQLKTQGCSMMWIEDCYSDMLPPGLFERLNIDFVKMIIAEIRNAGMRSIHYFCGNPYGKLDLLLSANADAYSFEESKKGFDIDIIDLAKYINGRNCLFGNIDSIGVLQNGSLDDIKHELNRQGKAGKLNGDRFVFALGSPVTPLTPMKKVIDFINIARMVMI